MKYDGLSVCIWRIETACETTADDIKELADSNLANSHDTEDYNIKKTLEHLSEERH